MQHTAATAEQKSSSFIFRQSPRRFLLVDVNRTQTSSVNMADFAKLSLGDSEEGAVTSGAVDRKLEPKHDNQEEEGDDEEEDDDDDDEGGGGEEAIGGSKKKKKKKKKSKKKKKGGVTPNQLPGSRLLGGYTDYYIKYGQTPEPSIPVADLFKDGMRKNADIFLLSNLYCTLS